MRMHKLSMSCRCPGPLILNVMFWQRRRPRSMHKYARRPTLGRSVCTKQPINYLYVGYCQEWHRTNHPAMPLKTLPCCCWIIDPVQFAVSMLHAYSRTENRQMVDICSFACQEWWWHDYRLVDGHASRYHCHIKTAAVRKGQY